MGSLWESQAYFRTLEAKSKNEFHPTNLSKHIVSPGFRLHLFGSSVIMGNKRGFFVALLQDDACFSLIKCQRWWRHWDSRLWPQKSTHDVPLIYPPSVISPPRVSDSSVSAPRWINYFKCVQERVQELHFSSVWKILAECDRYYWLRLLTGSEKQIVSSLRHCKSPSGKKQKQAGNYGNSPGSGERHPPGRYCPSSSLTPASRQTQSIIQRHGKSFFTLKKRIYQVFMR